LARVIIHEDKSPVEVRVGGESRWICQCGLSTAKPYCSGAHKMTQDEEAGKLYKYESGRRTEVRRP